MTKITLTTTEVDGSRRECVFETDYEMVTWVTLLDRFIDMLNGGGMCMEDKNKTEDFLHNRYGYCYFEVKDNSALIYNLYVEPEFRGKGHAKKLLKGVISEIRRRGYKDQIMIECKPTEQGINKDRLSSLYKEMGLLVISDTAKINDEQMKV